MDDGGKEHRIGEGIDQGLTEDQGERLIVAVPEAKIFQRMISWRGRA